MSGPWSTIDEHTPPTDFESTSVPLQASAKLPVALQHPRTTILFLRVILPLALAPFPRHPLLRHTTRPSTACPLPQERGTDGQNEVSERAAAWLCEERTSHKWTSPASISAFLKSILKLAGISFNLPGASTHSELTSPICSPVELRYDVSLVQPFLEQSMQPKNTRRGARPGMSAKASHTPLLPACWQVSTVSSACAASAGI